MNFENFINNQFKYKLIYRSVFAEILGIIAGISLGFGTFYYILLGSILLLVYGVISIKNKIALNNEALLLRSYKSQKNTILETLNKLFESTDDQNLAQSFFNKIINDSIICILEELGFIHDPGIRVSLYNHDGKNFTLLYRHSDNPEFQKKGRAIYPDNEGIIGDAYHKNIGYVSDLPNPEIDEEEWIRAQINQKQGKMKHKTVVKKLTMKSCNLLAIPIRSGTDKHIIIVFESTKKNQLNEKSIKNVLNGPHGLRLNEVLSMYRIHIEPSLEYANKMGM